MDTWRYKAVDPGGRTMSGTMEAANVTDLEMRLSRMGLDLINGRTVSRHGLLTRFKRVSRSELINFSFHLEQLLNAGVPIVDALRDLGATIEDPTFRDVVAELVEAIEGGRTFSEALSAFPGVFSKVYVSMVRVGEESGRLPKVLADLAGMLRWQDELIAHAKNVMIYPAMVFVVVGAVIGFLMIYLVPQLTSFLENMDVAMPRHTRVLIAVSDFFVAWWWAVLAGLIAIPLVIRYLSGASPRFRYRWDSFKLRLWLFGDFMWKLRLARFSNYFALMYASGISVLEALRLSRGLMDNVVLEQAIERVHTQIAEGRGISEAFASAGMFPPLIVRMMRVGETSGALDEALYNVSYFYSREVREAVERLQPTIQPLLIVLLGGLLGWIMLAVLGPVYSELTAIGF